MARLFKRNKRKRLYKQIKPEFIKFKKWIMSLISFLVFVISIKSTIAAEGFLWQESGAGIDENNITAICIIDNAPKVIFAGAGRSVYKSVDCGKTWRRVFMLKGEGKVINYITYDPRDSFTIFLATSDGLYISRDGGKNWQRSFRGKDELQRHITCITVYTNEKGGIYIGTKKGLFRSVDSGKNWAAQKAFINKEVSYIAVNNEDIYACAIDGLYYSKAGSDSWDRVYIVSPSEEDTNGDSDNDDSDEAEKINRLGNVAIRGECIYLATDRGVYILQTQGRDREKIAAEGLLTEYIRFILANYKGIFVATKKGVFLYDEKEKRWHDYSTGLATTNVNMLALSKKDDTVFAATEKGLYRAEFDIMKPEDSYQIEGKIAVDVPLFKDEPTIYQIQQAAVRYAEVSPEKIEWMRAAARNKAWLPEINLGLDGDTGRTLDIDRGGTNDRDFYIEGPKDKNFGWDISASWDLSELIWNDDQTNIDVRSRLMVQLRNDVLDEVTKLYFERKRLQLEIYNDSQQDNKDIVLKQLKLQELTANIDALTGGYLSEHLNE